jgi:glutathione S-transferase
MADYLLHCFAQSGNAYKPALALELSEADWAPRFVDYFNGETKSPAYRAMNVMGEVPMLEHRGAVLCQSGVILDYLADTLGKFGPDNPVERREILRWLLWDNHKLTSYTATYRYMRTFVKNPDAAVLDEFRRRAETAWGVLDKHLERRKYVVGERLTIADISLVGYLYFDDELGTDWSAFPAMRDWLARIKDEPRWVHPYDLMPGHPRT